MKLTELHPGVRDLNQVGMFYSGTPASTSRIQASGPGGPESSVDARAPMWRLWDPSGFQIQWESAQKEPQAHGEP